MSDTAPRAPTGLIDSLAAAAESLVGMAHTRLDLLSLDLEEDRAHFASLALVALSAFFCLGVGVVLSVLLLVAAFRDTHPLAVLAVLAGLFLVGGGLALRRASLQARTRPRLFTSSLRELERDRDQLAPRS